MNDRPLAAVATQLEGALSEADVPRIGRETDRFAESYPGCPQGQHVPCLLGAAAMQVTQIVEPHATCARDGALPLVAAVTVMLAPANPC